MELLKNQVFQDRKEFHGSKIKKALSAMDKALNLQVFVINARLRGSPYDGSPHTPTPLQDRSQKQTLRR